MTFSRQRATLRLCLLAVLGMTSGLALFGQTTIAVSQVTSSTTYASNSVLNAANGLWVGSESGNSVTLKLADVTTLTIDDVPANADDWARATIIGYASEAVLHLTSKATLTSNAARTWIGYSGNGQLKLENAASATFNGQVIVGGYLDGNTTGSVILSNSASLFAEELWIGAGKTGTLTASNDARITTTTAYVGTANIYNEGGESQGVGSAILSNSASWTSNEFYLGYGRGNAGTMILNGDASLTVTGETSRFKVGDDGGTGLLTLHGGTLTADNALIGGTNGNGTVILQNNAQVNTSSLNVGYTYTIDTGATGSVVVSSGAVNVSNTLRLGETGTGTMLISGSSSSLTVNGDAYIGSGNEGGSPGTGELTIQNGGAATFHGYTRIGAGEAATGTVSVTGSHSTFTSTSETEVTAGSSLTVSDGGLLQTSWFILAVDASLAVSNASWSLSESATLGGTVAASGNVSVTLARSGETGDPAVLDFGRTGMLSLEGDTLIDINLAFLSDLGAGTYTIATFADGNGFGESLLSYLTFSSPNSEYTVSASLTSTSLQVTAFQAVPEPGTWAMLASGLGLLGAAAWRRRR